MKKMFSKIDIDLEILSFSNININELLTLIKIYATNVHKQFLDYEIRKEDLSSLESKKMIRKVNDTKFIIRDLGNKLISRAVGIEIEGNKKPAQKTAIENPVEELVDKIREKFKGLKPGSMGDKKALTDKLIRWRLDNPDVSEEKILLAVDKYLDTQQNYRYLQRADYFIYKKSGNVESSRLSTFVDELELPTENSDWTSNLS